MTEFISMFADLTIKNRKKIQNKPMRTYKGHYFRETGSIKRTNLLKKLNFNLLTLPCAHKGSSCAS